MGFITKAIGKAAPQAEAAQSNFRAEYNPLADEERRKYDELISAIQGGGGPSAVDAYTRTQQDRATANAMAMANSARGDVNPAMMQRMAMRQAADQQQAIAQQGSSARQQEALGLTNLYSQLGMQGDLANQQAKQAAQGINANVSMGNVNAANSVNAANLDSKNKMIGGVIQGASTAAMMSDENQKKNISSGAGEIQEFLDALKAHKYQYKDKAYGEGEFISPMAQEIEKTPVGESMVENTPKGKMVNYGKGFGAVLAAQAQLNERLKKLEKKNG